jgi:hypothetical protein
MLPGAQPAPASKTSPAMKFVVMVGVMSFFADFAYEGSRSITGPYLGLLGAGAFTISVVSGAGATSCRCRWSRCSRWPEAGRPPPC